MFEQLRLLLKISSTGQIARRYFVVNGFDGALTMLGIIMGFYFSDRTDLNVVTNACFGAAIALGMSGLSSAYISETAEQKRQLQDLEGAMLADLGTSAHGRAARHMPPLIAAVNGLSPLLICLVIIGPIWVVERSLITLPEPLLLSLITAGAVLFLFGLFLGRIGGTFWLWSGVRTLLVATVTVLLIYLMTHL